MSKDFFKDKGFCDSEVELNRSPWKKMLYQVSKFDLDHSTLYTSKLNNNETLETLLAKTPSIRWPPADSHSLCEPVVEPPYQNSSNLGQAMKLDSTHLDCHDIPLAMQLSTLLCDHLGSRHEWRRL